MLDAAARNKLRLKKHSLVEDEITSSIFGPVAYMQPSDAWEVIKDIARKTEIHNNLPSGIPSSFDIEFWPKHETIEPDIKFCCQFPDNTTCSFLIEIKWRASLNPPCELVRQWLTRPFPGERWFHIYVVPLMAVGKQDCEKSVRILKYGCKSENCTYCSGEPLGYRPPLYPDKEAEIWQECLGVIDWSHIQGAVEYHSRHGKTSNIRRWGRGVNSFLEKHGYIPFTGFAWLEKSEYEILSEDCGTSFFNKSDWLSFLTESRYPAFCQTGEYLQFFQKEDKER